MALDHGTPGQAYFILDEGEVSMKEMVTGMAASKGLVLPDKSVPGWLAGAIGSLCEAIWRIFNLKGAPPLTKHAAMVMSRDCTLKGDKAKAELGYRPVVSREAGLAAMKAAG